ncbi:TRAP transporter large permease [Sinanaerobacter chloroacetimidivorans]|uniref:TRAP transporter large permease n=1 Tax=Sinanaerobacter chloroacetimidivorans TaxID=2818044 RepID=A0A8J7W1L2_9FIRM|nr:TRAP transporter large permease [Sinanaerobacter chloroacetimidivorans]MBR0597466.1 TRAP transporter large permease [Sinanaerobacter chloroacetimidivorans]
MEAAVIAALSIVGLLVLVLLGVHVIFSLALMSFIGIWLLTSNFNIALSLLGTTSFSGVKEYTFTVIPLFILMGSFMGRSGVARDLFDTANYLVKKLPGGMGIATVVSNAVFAAVTGASVASATVFSKISFPAMKSYNYKTSLALGAVAGSSVLGMLIPPSVLMIIYGMLSETSIGKLFVAGVIPGLVMVFIYSIGIILMCTINPELGGRFKNEHGKWVAKSEEGETDAQGFLKLFIKSAPIFGVVLLVIGGIWGGFFTPTEASAVGAFSTFLISMARGMRWNGIKAVFMDSAGTIATVMFLLIAAKMYSRMLAMSGVTVTLASMIADSGLGSGMVLFLICAALVLLGCVLDSNSILLIMVPLILPVAAVYGWDLLWFGIVMIIVVEMGILTPPFGMVVFAMKSTIGDEVKVEEIFRGAAPFIFMMVIVILLCIFFPPLVTWLPSLI